MNNELFENLLFEEEGTTLDFKRDQYRFEKASEEEKSELVKDLIGFANAWRRTTGYILVGVEDVRGGRSNVIGIPASDQLQDHSLQQFVNSLVNTPIRFNYRAFTYEGKQVGIFVIEEGQDRPIHLTKKYGKLDKDKVYVRWGSSTDPTKPASPSDIARMGASRSRERADLVVEFAEVDRDNALGDRVHVQYDLCSLPASDDIPDLADPDDNTYGIRINEIGSWHNPDYYRDLAEYRLMTRLCRRVRLAVRNVGQVAANNVRVEITVAADQGVLATLEMPQEPRKRQNFGERFPVALASAQRREPGGVGIDQNADRYRIVIDGRDLQPGRQIRSDVFYIGVGKSGNHLLQGLVLADNLPVPQQFTLTLTAEVTQTALTLKDLLTN
ncbi:MAG: hypothetical protein JWN34_3507 [Bryobacterales bacterium]|nr:hypothetical protein [Bryobacterales bacterium]